jgi:CelD/BcsL family acetyltransferase involved in cellulose biosynthesis
MVDASYTVSAVGSAEQLRALAAEWNPLATAVPSPFLTTEWLASWEDAFGGPAPSGLVLRDGQGALAAGAWLPRPRPDLHQEAIEHLGDWDVVARDDDARAAVWRALLETTPSRVSLPGLVSVEASTAIARGELEAAGYRLIERPGYPSPHLTLPATTDELMASVSRNLRSQSGRRRRALEREGELRLRTVTGGDELPAALDAFLALEAAGWKGREGSAVLAHPEAERHLRRFAADAAASGVLRMYLLELGGRLVAADYGAAIGGTGFLFKTTYDEELHRLSPGLVLRAEVLRASIEEGLGAYDFLGGAETYKMQWGAVLRPRVELVAYRGPRQLATWAWLARVRPAIVPLAKRLLRRGERAGPQSAESGAE